MVSLEHLPEPIGCPGSWQWQVFSLKLTDFSHSHGPAKTGDCTHLPDLPSQLAISLYICIILCKGYSAFLIRVFHTSCKSALQCMRVFASKAKCKLPLPGHAAMAKVYKLLNTTQFLGPLAKSFARPWLCHDFTSLYQQGKVQIIKSFVMRPWQRCTN